jgi:hypothetical protein
MHFSALLIALSALSICAIATEPLTEVKVEKTHEVECKRRTKKYDEIEVRGPWLHFSYILGL